MSCKSLPVPQLTEQASDGDSIVLVADSAYKAYIWYYHRDSDKKENFTAIDTTGSPVFHALQTGNYYVTVVDAFGCRADSEILKIVISSTDAAEFYDIQVFPNPVSDKLTIQTAKPLPNARIEIRNSTGQLMKNFESSLPGTISLQNMPDGIYFVKIFEGQKYYVVRVVKD